MAMHEEESADISHILFVVSRLAKYSIAPVVSVSPGSRCMVVITLQPAIFSIARCDKSFTTLASHQHLLNAEIETNCLVNSQPL
jgi:hypothetical protein